MLVFLIRDREDTVLVALGLALDLFCLDPDPKRAFDDPGKQAGCTVTNVFTGVPKGFGLDRVGERDGLQLGLLIPFFLDEIEPAHLGVERKGHVGEGLGVRDAHLLVVLDVLRIDLL